MKDDTDLLNMKLNRNAEVDIRSAAPMSRAPSGHSNLEPVVRQKQEQKKSHTGLIIALIIIFLLFTGGVFVGVWCFYRMVLPYSDYDLIYPNVYCIGIDLGGMTKEEATEALSCELQTETFSLEIDLPDNSYTICPEQSVHFTDAEIDTIVNNAYSYLRQDTTPYGAYKAYQEASKSEYHIDASTTFSYSQEDVITQVSAIYDETVVDPTDIAFSVDNEQHTVTITPSGKGHYIDEQALTAEAIQAFDTMDFSAISVEYIETSVDEDALEQAVKSVCEKIETEAVATQLEADAENHAIKVSVGTPGYFVNTDDVLAAVKSAEESNSTEDIVISMEEITPETADVSPLADELYCEPTNPYYENGQVYEGDPGYALDIEAAQAEIDSAPYGETITIQLEEVAPELSAADVEAVLFRDQLSSFKTAHVANAARTQNLTLACNAINGTVLNSGETFSFNNIVGERTAAKGYQSATVYVGNDSVSELGGGICQVASTIYDAALYAELQITDRAPHNFFVTYVDGGLDATVYWGSQDFCFKNNTDYPIRINASVSGGYVHISIDGTKTNDHYVVLSSKKLSTTNYSTVTEYSSEYRYGTTQVTVTPYTGYSYEAYQYIYDSNNNLIDTIYLGVSDYKKRDKVITIGTGL